MAFNFNWTPLTTTSTTSSAFYTHAKSLLTAALNKSQKPPIIVDDIFVEELNLGQSAPDLEILEIGDLAEDRFRGIFRMNYEGDASLTLRTKVQVCIWSLVPSYSALPTSRLFFFFAPAFILSCLALHACLDVWQGLAEPAILNIAYVTRCDIRVHSGY